MRIAVIDWETGGLDPAMSALFEFGYVMGETARPTNQLLATGRIIVPQEYNNRTSRYVSQSTLKWWIEETMKSSELGQHTVETLELASKGFIGSFQTKLEKFMYELNQHQIEGIFCTDKSFDHAILLAVCHDLNIHFPLSYKQCFETRYMSSIQAPGCFDKRDAIGPIVHTAQDDALLLYNSLCCYLNTP